MTTDAAPPRQRFSGDGWSLAAHDTGGLSVHTPLGLDLMPGYPAREAVEASWGAA